MDVTVLYCGLTKRGPPYNISETILKTSNPGVRASLPAQGECASPVAVCYADIFDQFMPGPGKRREPVLSKLAN